MNHPSKTQGAHRLVPPLAMTLALISAPLGATSYGSYDARAQAMGGTSIAAGNSAQAPFYNPSLLAFNGRDENLARDGRFAFPHLALEVSDTSRIAFDALEDELDNRLRSAINRYNNSPSSENTAQVAQSAADLAEVLNQLANQDLTLDSFFGLSVSEPSKSSGGAFVFGVRTLGAASTSVTPEDQQLLADYIEAMALLGAGVPPELIDQRIVDENGRLRDPIDDLTSKGSVGALFVAEWGVSFAKQFEVYNQQLALGLTPKIMRVDAFRDTVDLSTGNTSINDPNAHISDTRKTHLSVNLDAGASLLIARRVRLGLAIKDVLPKEFATRPRRDLETGEFFPTLSITYKPRARAGIAYLGDQFTLGLDYDLRESTPLADEAPRQDLALGLELRPLNWLSLRAGYRQDQLDLGRDLTSAGLGLRWRRLLLDLGYATGEGLEAGSLQISWAF